MIVATCHCGSVVVEAKRRPSVVTSCNCSICARLGALWAYYTSPSARVARGREETEAYVWGQGRLEFHHCRHCGCCTHYESVGKGVGRRFAVNGRCMPTEVLAKARVRHFDGAATFRYLD